jgi:hypothetical protein
MIPGGNTMTITNSDRITKKNSETLQPNMDGLPIYENKDCDNVVVAGNTNSKIGITLKLLY